eukprot:1736660-Ditylum_brightwellii.AAC.2
MEAMFFATPVTDSGQILWCDLVTQHYHVTKLIFVKNRVVGNAWDHIDPVVHALAGPFHTPHMVSSAFCLK